MFSYDFITTTPLDELQSAWERVPSNEFSQIGSLEGRAVCIWKICHHTLAIVLKPALYLAVGISIIALATIVPEEDKREMGTGFYDCDFGINMILTALVTPLGQICQLAKASLGILHPGCYFKRDELDQYFVNLAEIAEEVNCESQLIELLKQGSRIVYEKQKQGNERVYYHALFKRDLAMLCEKLSDPHLTPDHKAAVLDMLAPLPEDPLQTGIYACSPGFGRLLEQMCFCLNMPQEFEQIFPWLLDKYKLDILNNLALDSEIANKYGVLNFSDKKLEPPHIYNLLIMNLGEKITLSKSLIDSASQDLSLKQIFKLSENEQQKLLEIFNELYTPEAALDYLVQQISSQPDGGPGLKNMRQYMIRKLIENVDETEIASSKEEIQKQLGISAILAEDPAYYVQFHYFLYPDMDPSDERSTDLNAEGIKAFAKIQDFHF